MKERKYLYLKVLQVNYGYGWDDLHTYDAHDNEDMEFLKQHFTNYRQNVKGSLFRVINRRKAKPQVNRYGI